MKQCPVCKVIVNNLGSHFIRNRCQRIFQLRLFRKLRRGQQRMNQSRPDYVLETLEKLKNEGELKKELDVNKL